MTDRLDEIQARAEAATEGPWEERWLPIPGYDGYEVSDFGNVRSYYLKGNHIKKRARYPRTLKTVPRPTGGYQTVSLKDPDGCYRHKSVHRLVMLAFVGPCPTGMEVAHLNGDNSDARLSNLQYVTHRENESHKIGHGTSGIGERNSNATLQGWQVAEVKYLAGRSVPQGNIAKLFGMSHKQVNDILQGKSWAHTAARTDVPALLAEVRRLQAATDRVRALHKPVAVYAYADECGCRNEDHELIESAEGDYLCWNTPTGETRCRECLDEDGGGIDYPCPTVQAVDAALGAGDE